MDRLQAVSFCRWLYTLLGARIWSVSVSNTVKQTTSRQLRYTTSGLDIGLQVPSSSHVDSSTLVRYQKSHDPASNTRQQLNT